MELREWGSILSPFCMAEISAFPQGREEIETKILAVDPKETRRRLIDAGAGEGGHFTVTEMRYVATEALRAAGFSGPRLRELLDQQGVGQVELVLKRKNPALCLPGNEVLGPRFKWRTEHEVIVPSSAGERSSFTTLQAMLGIFGLQLRGHLVTSRTSYLLEGVRFEVDRILSFNGDSNCLPPPFLEIEGPTPERIAQAVEAIGYRIEDCVPLTKQQVIEAFRQQGA